MTCIFLSRPYMTWSCNSIMENPCFMANNNKYKDKRRQQENLLCFYFKQGILGCVRVAMNLKYKWKTLYIVKQHFMRVKVDIVDYTFQSFHALLVLSWFCSSCPCELLSKHSCSWEKSPYFFRFPLEKSNIIDSLYLSRNLCCRVNCLVFETR